MALGISTLNILILALLHLEALRVGEQLHPALVDNYFFWIASIAVIILLLTRKK